MKTKTEVLKLWRRAYNNYEKAKDIQTQTQYMFMLLAYESVLEMNRLEIKRKLKINIGDEKWINIRLAI